LALAQAYGEPVVSKVGKVPLQPSHFIGTGVLEGFVERCLKFQASQLKDEMAKSEAAKYFEDKEVFNAHALVAPYFYLNESTLSDWLPLNLRAARCACEMSSLRSFRVMASIVVSQGVVTDKEACDKIAKDFSSLRVHGYLLWVDALDEQAASGSELRGLLYLAKALGKGGERDVVSLHGGYFSVLAAGPLGGNAMTGVAHGPEFGEYREVVPVGGGIPLARYYIPQLHARVRYRDALRIFTAAKWLNSAGVFHSEVCDCQECKDVVAGNPDNFHLFGDGTVKSVRRRHGIVRIEFPTVETKLRCLRHYLQRKHREYKAAAEAGRETLLADLQAGEDKFKEIAGLDSVAHLRLWRSILSAL
jgi:hypothetical protein